MGIGITLMGITFGGNKNDIYHKAWHDGFDLQTTMRNHNIPDTLWCPDCYEIYMRDSGYTKETWDSIFTKFKGE